MRNSRVWQDKTVIEIVESVFQSYAPAARWRWSDDTRPFMDGAPARSYSCQYRESDLDFVSRLLTEEGLAWRFEEQEGGHCLVLFADSSADSAVPEDASSAAGGGIRFHGVRVGEPGDSALDVQAAPLKAMLASVAGMHEQLPHTKDAIIAIAARAGLGVVAGQDLQLANGETVTLMSGQDTQWSSGGKWRLHTGQAIGMLGGAVKAGEGDAGVQLIAAQGAIDVQAQADVLNVQAREEVNVISANAHVDWAAAKSIRLSTAGGANITIEGGNITIQCPGKITVFAGKKSFIGPTRAPYVMPPLPSSTCKNCILSAMQQGAAGVLR